MSHIRFSVIPFRLASDASVRTPQNCYAGSGQVLYPYSVYHACVLLVRYLYCAVSGQAESRGWYPESGVSGI